MNALEKLVRETFEQFFAPGRVGSLLVIRKLQQQGLKPRLDRFTDLVEALSIQIEQQLNAGTSRHQISLTLDDEFFDLEGSTSALDQSLDLFMTSEDVEDFEAAVESTIEEATMDAFTKAFPAELLKGWKEARSRVLENERQANSGFQKYLHRHWGEALNLLEMLISICVDLGHRFNEECRTADIRDFDARLDVLTRLHARWRTLHELATVATVIADSEQAIAHRFLDHIHIENYKTKEFYLQNPIWGALTDEEIADIERGYEDVLTRYGRPFLKDYGWAAPLFGGKSPTFEQIEQKMELGHQRIYYKMANLNVHGGAKGIGFRLGAYSAPDELLAGRSIYGLGEPGRNTAYSIVLLTSNVLLARNESDQVVNVGAIYRLMEETHHAFYTAEDHVEGLRLGTHSENL